MRRDDEDAVGHADARQLAGTRPISELLQLEVQLPLLLGEPGIDIARNSDAEIVSLYPAAKGGRWQKMRVERTITACPFDPNVARPQPIA